jgi:hypothetical protein
MNLYQMREFEPVADVLQRAPLLRAGFRCYTIVQQGFVATLFPDLA